MEGYDQVKVFVGLYGHLNGSVLPLRFGIALTEHKQRFCTLVDYTYDEEGTNRQRPDEVKKGRKHFLGTLQIPSDFLELKAPPLCGRWVIEPPEEAGKLPSVITGLREDLTGLKGDITVTKHLDEMLKRNRVTTEEIIKYMHPEYVAGKIMNSNDLELILEDVIRPSRGPSPIPSDGPVVELPPVPTAPSDPSDETNDRYPLVYEPMAFGSNIKYEYVWADAFILDAGMEDKLIWAKIINSKGEEQTIRSFAIRDHLRIHHDYALQYLLTRKEQRGYMAICISKPYEGVLAESVTSIALDLYKNQ